MNRNNPNVRREILINSSPYEKRIAILESNHLAEIFYEYPETDVLVGNIYKGVVNAVLPGLQAAFVDIGLEKAGFLHVDDVVDRTARLRRDYDDEADGKGGSEPLPTIDKLLKVGQQILVQVTKEPISTKGPRLTAHLALAGRFLVCLPGTGFVGVSKKTRDHSLRRQLRRLVMDLKSPDIGFIVRTLGLGETEEEFTTETHILEAKWRMTEEAAKAGEAPCLVYQESDTLETTLRDYFSEGCERVMVDDEEEYKNIINYLKVLSPGSLDKVQMYTGNVSIFDHFGLEEELERTFESKVPLRRGGSIVIEQAEALVAIDVNTGGKVRGFNQAKNIVETNIDAAWEIAKQLRLRDLGGLLVIDFIDMEKDEDIQMVEAEFKKAIRQDKTPIHFSLISQFGLMELTRKRVRPNKVKSQSSICPTCQGNRYIPKKGIVIAAIERVFRRIRAAGKAKEITLILHPRMIDPFIANRGHILKYIETKHQTRIELAEDAGLNLVEFRLFNTKSGEELTAQYTTAASFQEELDDEWDGEE